MTGSSPNDASSPSSNQNDRPDQNQQPKYSIPYRPLPRLFVVRDPPDGPYDEVCITVCTQTINKRLNNFLPECKTYCVRKVFKHELQALSKELDIDLPPPRTQADDKSLLFTERTMRLLNEENDLQQSNLPVEVARTESGADGVIGVATTIPTRPANANANRHEPFWREGYYLWYGKGRLAEHYKSEQMSRRLQEYENIRRQFEHTWSVSELERRKRAKDIKGHQRGTHSASGPVPYEEQQHGTTTPVSQGQAAPPQPRSRSQHRSLSDIQSESAAARRRAEEQTGISAWFQRNTQHVQPLTEPPPYRPTNSFPHSGTLVPVPPHPLIALRDEIYRRWQIAVTPTQKLYNLVIQSYTSGQQKRVREAVWAHVRGGGLDRFAEQLDGMIKEMEKREEERKAKESSGPGSKSGPGSREGGGGQGDSV